MNRAVVRCERAAQKLEQRCLSFAVSPNQTDSLARLKRKLDAVE